MSAETHVDFQVRRDDLRQCRFVRSEPAALEPGQVRLRVERFAFTANNVSYAMAGDMLGYWGFFPAEEGWGRIPVWGFGSVAESRCDALPEGGRVYGYLPMSSELVVQPDAVTPADFRDVSPHRAALPVVYNQYTRFPRDDDGTGDRRMLQHPLVMTAFLLDDFLADEDFFGARRVVLTSASSKTAFGLAFMLKRHDRPCEVAGLTSPRNLEFVKGLGCYDRVLRYEDVTSLPAEPAVVVDMAGDGEVLSALHHHLRDDLQHSCLVGATHWERGKREPMPGPEPKFFFAPERIQKRAADWGPALAERMEEAWQRFLAETGDWIRVVRESGEEAVERVYLDNLEGRARPDVGHVLSL